MSIASTFLRVLLMISLVFNGLNVAAAGGHAMAAPNAATFAAEPPCHSHSASSISAALPAAPQAGSADSHGDCKLKECLRVCAQQPALTTAGLPLLAAAPAVAGPAGQRAPRYPTGAPSPLHRPPIR